MTTSPYPAPRESRPGDRAEADGVHDARWRKSSRSAAGGDCVEVARLITTVAVRDSKLDTTGEFPMLTMSTTDWSGFLASVRSA